MNRIIQFILWLFIWYIIVRYTIFLPKNIYLFYRYQIDTYTDKNLINNIDIHNIWSYNHLSGIVKTDKDDILRLEFNTENIENKILFINLTWSGNIEWYFLWDSPFLNCNSRIISENKLCEKSYNQFYITSQLFKAIQNTWIVRQNIVGIPKDKFYDIIKAIHEWSDYFKVILELQPWYDYSFAHFLYMLIWKNTSLYKKIPTFKYPNPYSKIYLNNGENYIFFDPYDLLFLKETDKIWYIIYLSWNTEFEYNFIDNPIFKNNNKRQDFIKSSYNS